MARIVVVGSVARDEVVRLAEPLRPGAHLQGVGPTGRLGGGGANTAVALAHAGHDVALVAVVGDDALGGVLLGELAAAGVSTGMVLRVAGPSTRSIVLAEPGGERTILNLTRAREPGPPERLLAGPAPDCVYVRTRAPGMAPLLARVAGQCPVIAHVPPLEAGWAPVPVLVGSASDLDEAALADPFAAGRAVAGDTLRWMVITEGPAGARAFGRDTALFEPARRVRAVDSTGAGDAFAAGLAHALASGQPMDRALAVAVAWGGESVRWDSSSLPAEAVRRLAPRF